MKRAALFGIAAFVGVWVVCWIGGIVKTLHWTTPLDWDPNDRALAYGESLLFGIAVFAMSLTWGKRP